MASIHMAIPRPPTPPRSSSNCGLSSDLDAESPRKNGLTATPDESPASGAVLQDTGSGRSRKRVDFSPWTPPVFTSSSNVHHPIRPLPPSRECKSSTSILKSSAQSAISHEPENSTVHSYDTLTEMLKSVLQQLAADNRPINIDAYATVAGTFKAYNNIAEGPKLKEQIQNLCKYIRRDLQNETSEIGVADSSIITSALKVVVVLVWDKCLSAMLTDEFRSFLLDRSIKVLENEKSSKAVILHCLHLLATQNFRSNVMTNIRATRVLEAMQVVTQRIAGNNVIIERQMVYQKFTEQVPIAMNVRMEWLEHLIDGMTSNVAFIRNKAISFGTAAAKTFGGNSSTSKHLNSIFDRELEDSENYLTYSIRRLDVLLSKSDEGTAVPRIWAITVRLLRGNNLQSFERGKHLKRLLILIQKCFNSSHADIRTAAYSAWNQFILSVHPSDKTPRTLRQVLATPITGQLSRSDTGKLSKSHRTAAASAYCCLLYYSFRPGALTEQYNPLFLEYVSNIWTDSFLSIPSNVDRACRILMALFWNEKGRFWTESRVHELSVFEPEDLPRVDPKWARSQSKQILDVFGLLFRKAYWGPQYPEASFVARAWNSYCQALGEACRKEVKPSTETMDTVAHFMNLLHKVWEDGLAALNASDASAFLDRFWFLLRAIAVQIGGIPFTEHTLNDVPKHAFSSRSENMSAISNAAHSHSATPFELLLLLLKEQPGHVVLDGAKVSSIVQATLQLFVDNRATTLSRLQLLGACLVKIAQGAEVDSNVPTKDNLSWIIYAILQVTKTTLKSDLVTNVAKERDSQPGLESDIVIILQTSLCANFAHAQQWTETFHQAISYVKTFKGNKITVEKVLEPLACELEKKLSTLTTLSTAVLVHSFAETREFWEVSTPAKMDIGHTERLSSTVEIISSATNKHLIRSYLCSSVDDILSIRKLLDACATLIKDCPEQQLIHCLTPMSEGLLKWLQDPDRCLGGVQDLATAKRSSARTLWSSVTCRLCEMTYDSQNLTIFEDVFIACFSSTQRDVVNTMIAKWNDSFGTNESLTCPAALQSILLRLRPHVDLYLPGLAVRERETDYSSTPRVSDADDDERRSEIYSKPFLPSPLTPKNTLKSPDPLRSKSMHDKLNQASPSTPSVPRRGLRERETRKMLPHDDSQVTFTVINNSASLDQNLDSQYMAEHQKEVRQRQKSDVATAFFDMRSSPGLETDRTRRSESIGLPTVLADKASAEPFTPDLAPEDTSVMDDHVMSSPTPQSSQKTNKLTDVDVPSSPLSSYEEQETHTLTRLVTEAANGTDAQPASGTMKQAGLEDNTTHVITPGLIVDGTHSQPPGRIKQVPKSGIISTAVVLGEISPNIQTEPLRQDHHDVDHVLPAWDRTTPDQPKSIIPTSSDAVNLSPRLKGTADSYDHKVDLTNEGESDSPRTDSDEYDSQISIQLSQEITNYADTWETVPNAGIASFTESILSTGEANVGKVSKDDVDTMANDESDMTRPAFQEMEDTITVQGPKLGRPLRRGGQQEGSGDGVEKLVRPLVEIVEDGAQTKPATESTSPTSIVTKRKAEALLSLKAGDNPSDPVIEDTPTKRAKTAVGNECTRHGEETPPVVLVQHHLEISKGMLITTNRTEPEAVDGHEMCKQGVVEAGATGASIIQSLQDVWQELGRTNISRDELRAIHDLVFDIRSTAEESARRGS